MATTRAVLIDIPYFGRDPELRSIEVSTELIRSVRYWPVGTGLQIDIVSHRNGKFYAVAKLLGNYFDEWIDEVTEIVGRIAKVVPISIKEHDEIVQAVVDKVKNGGEVLEILPPDETQNLTPDDFSDEFETEMDEFGHLVFVQDYPSKSATPVPAAISTQIILDCLSRNDHLMMRTVISPTDANTMREMKDEFLERSSCFVRGIYTDCEVVNARSFVASGKRVPVLMKRIVTQMSPGSTLMQLDKIEIANIFKNPLKEIQTHHRMGITAASWIRIPILESDFAPKQQRSGLQGKSKDEISKIVDDILKERTHTICTTITDAVIKSMEDFCTELVESEVNFQFSEFLESATKNHSYENIFSDFKSELKNEFSNDKIIDDCSRNFPKKLAIRPERSSSDAQS